MPAQNLRKRQNEQGSTLITALVALAISGILATFLAKSLTQQHQSTRHIQVKGDVDTLRRYIIGNISCARTFSQPAPSPNPCNGAGQFIDVISEPSKAYPLGKVLVAAAKVGAGKPSFTAFGDALVVRSRCFTDASGKRFLIEANRFKPGTVEPLKDPLTAKLLDGSLAPASPTFKDGWLNLFPVGNLCEPPP